MNKGYLQKIRVTGRVQFVKLVPGSMIERCSMM